MSRSRKKVPVTWLCSNANGQMKLWKKQCNRQIRRANKELANGNSYKKVHDIWTSPSDGKVWIDWHEKGYRK